MTDVRTEARRLIKQEDFDTVEQRIKDAAAEMDADVRRARQRDAVAKLRVKQLAAREQTKASILEACGAIMVSVRVLVAKMRELFKLYGVLRTQQTELKEECPVGWSPFEVPVRYGFRIASELSKISGIANALGSVRWSLHGAFPAGADWSQGETKILHMKDENNASSQN